MVSDTCADQEKQAKYWARVLRGDGRQQNPR